METSGATLQDGQHELHIYKCEEKIKLETLSYLSLPSTAREPNYPGKLKIEYFLFILSWRLCDKQFFE